MAHHHHHHEHDDAASNKLLHAFILISAFVGVEVLGGLLANSLALLADAGHMALDAVALGLAAYAAYLSRRAENDRLSYGYHRYQVLAAAFNALLLLALTAWIVIEAIGRLRVPETMLPIPALIIASIGFVVNLIAFRWLHGSTDNMNVRAAALHVLGDLLGSVAAMTAALCVWLWGWAWADPILAFVIAGILIRGAVSVLREASHILLEGVPSGVDIDAIKVGLAKVDDVLEIHHVHAWSLTPDMPMVTLHATVDENADGQRVLTELKTRLADAFGIEHSTIQVEPGPCPDA